MSFYNEQLTPENLPEFRQVEFHGLEKKYLNVLFLSRMVFTIIIAIIFVGIALFAPFYIPVLILWATGIFISILFISVLILTPAAFRIKAYGIRARDILYRDGLIFRTTTIVPFNRVQHVELKSGPIDRWFGLSRIKVYTAGGSQSDLTIPGLKTSTASSLKELIITKTSKDEEE